MGGANEVEEDEEEPEAGDEGEGTKDTPIDVAADVVAPLEVPKSVEGKQKPGVEGATTGALPKK